MTRLLGPGGNTIDIDVDQVVPDVTSHEEDAQVHVILRVGGKTTEEWGMVKTPEEARREANNIMTHLADPNSDVWVEPNFRHALELHDLRRYRLEEDAR